MMPLIAPPGTYLGPCYAPCDHLPCEQDRWTARQRCPLCLCEIGYLRPYEVDQTPHELVDVGALGGRDVAPLVVIRHRECVVRAELIALGVEPDEVPPETAAALLELYALRVPGSAQLAAGLELIAANHGVIYGHGDHGITVGGLR